MGRAPGDRGRVHRGAPGDREYQKHLPPHLSVSVLSVFFLSPAEVWMNGCNHLLE